MKKFFTALSLILLFSSVSYAEVKNTIDLKLSEKVEKEICKIPLWNKKDLMWVSSTDERSQKELGWQSKGNKDSVDIFSEKPLEQVFEQTLKPLFQKCGANFVKADQVESYKLSLKIVQFDSGVKKGFFSGKEKAQSRLSFTFEKGNQTRSADVGFEIESKKFRKNGLKQLQQSLNELFERTIEQVFLSEQLKRI